VIRVASKLAKADFLKAISIIFYMFKQKWFFYSFAKSVSILNMTTVIAYSRVKNITQRILSQK